MNNRIIPFSVKLSYGFGAIGKDMVYSLVATFIMFYFTDVIGLTPSFVGILFFATRIWDALNDPVMGMVIDKTRTRWGKFRPWLLSGTLINAFVLIMLFFNPGFEGAGNYIYFSIVYILWGMSYTVMDIPYWSLIPSLTSTNKEREKLSVVARVFASLGFFIVATVGLHFVNGVGEILNKIDLTNIPFSINLLLEKPPQEVGYLLLAIVVSIIFILTILITVINVKEEHKSKNVGVKVSDIFKSLFYNDQALVVIATMIIFNTVTYLTTGLGLYYFKYIVGNELKFAEFTIVAGVSQVAAMLLFPVISRNSSHKTVFKLSVILPVIGYSLLLLLSITAPSQQIPLMISGAILFLGLGLSQVLSTVMLANVVDYGEWKHKKRNEGVIFSMQPFMVKFASAVSALIIGVGLELFGFEANTSQTLLAKNGIRLMMFVLPPIGLFFSWLIYNKHYKLNETEHKKIIEDIEQRDGE